MSVSAAWRALVVVGGLGAFTTFSTYSLEVLTLGRVQDYRTAALYIVSSNLLCIAAVLAGFGIARAALAAGS